MTKGIFSQYGKFCTYGFLRNLRFFEAFLIVFLLDRGFSYTQIGLFYALREISANILEIPSGISADVLGRRRTLAGSFVLYMFSFFIFYFFTNSYLYGAAFIFYGAGEAFRSGTHKGMIADYLEQHGEKERMASYYGHTRSWSQVGLALSSLLAGLLVFITGKIDRVFLFSIIPNGINFFLILSYPRELDRKEARDSTGEHNSWKTVVYQSFHALADRQNLKLLNLTALHTAFLKSIKDYVQPVILAFVISSPFLKDFEYDKRAALLLGSVYFIIYFLSSRASAAAGKLTGFKHELIPGLTLLAGLAAGLFGGFFLYISFPVITIFFFLVIHLVENLRKPLLTGYLSNRVDSAVLTTVLSVQSQLKTFLTAVLAVLFGFLADRFSVGEALIYVSAVLLLLSFFSIRPIKHD